MNLIVPMAGKSSRYPGVKPKWMLAHPKGNFMVVQSISGFNLNQFEKIVFVYLQEHEELYHFKRGFVNELDKLGITNYILCPLDSQTKDVTETVIQAINLLNISGSILIKDSDSFFSCNNIPEGNFVCYCKLQNTKCTKPGASSYIVLNENNIVTNIVEKKIISQNICVGGYAFEDAEEFINIASNLTSNTERYISDIIYFSILHKHSLFRGVEVTDLEDWGTLDDWRTYQKQFATLFVDIDGVIVNHSSHHFPPYIGESDPLTKNVDYIKKLCSSGKVEIVFTTCRSEIYREVTENQLKDLGLKYSSLVMGLQHGQRIIVNDYSPNNPYRCCDAINLKRNSEDLPEMLSGLFKL